MGVAFSCPTLETRYRASCETGLFTRVRWGAMKWLEFAFYCALDVAVAAVFSQFAAEGNKPFAFFVAMGVLWLLPLAIGLWGFVKFWISYHLFVKRRLVRYFKAKMHESDFPPSAAYIDHMQYLSDVIDDETEQKAKTRAAALIGELTCYRESKPFTMGAASQSALQVAMEEYKP